MTIEAKGAVSMRAAENVLPGTYYDWHQGGGRVAGYRADGGQLLWRTEHGTSERALAILVDGAPVEVVDVLEPTGNPRRLPITCRPIGSKEEPFAVELGLAELFERFLAHSERIDAKRKE